MVSADAVVIGGGMAGTSVALELARRDVSVLLCEQGRTPGEGATTWSGGLLRAHHTAHCTTALAARSLPVFQHWGDAVGGECGYHRTGFVMIVARRLLGHLRRNAAAVQAAGVATEVVSTASMAQRYPALSFAGHEDADLVAAYEPDGGYVDPAACARSLLAAAVARGVRLSEGVAVTRIVIERDQVAGVQTTLGRICAPRVVLAAGAWSARLLGSAGLTLPVEPRRIGIARAHLDAGGGALPAGIDDTLGTYFKAADSQPGGGVYFGVTADPQVTLDTRPAPVTQEEAQAAAKRISTRIPAVRAAAICGARAGFDGYTPDRQPIIGAADLPGLYISTGFSGGGVKIAPAVASLLAAEVAGEDPDPLLAPYRPQRFVTGSLIESEYRYVHS